MTKSYHPQTLNTKHDYAAITIASALSSGNLIHVIVPVPGVLLTS